MFGFGERETRKVAKELTELLHRFVDKYQRCNHDFLFGDIPKLFPQGFYQLDGDFARFVQPGFLDFQFEVLALGSDSYCGDGLQRQVNVVGRNDYKGFRILAQGTRDEWFCSTLDGPLNVSTAGAKKLVRLLDTEFGIVDHARLMGGAV